jgi:phage terminase large subunit
MINAQHTDNPRLFNHLTGEWTEAGKQYIRILNDLTGTRKLRLKDGIWCMADGMVFDGFREDVHVFNGWHEDYSLHHSDLQGRYDDAVSYLTDPPKSWRRTLAIDFGYANPFVCQFWAEDEDGRLYMYREIYQTHLLVEDAARLIIRLCDEHDEPGFDDIITDWDAEDRATLERHLQTNWRFARLNTTAAEKTRKSGCDAVQTRLKLQGDGRPRIYFRRDAEVRRDPELETQHKPQCTIEEIYGYVYNDKGEPEKENDHGCDAARYRVATTDLHALNNYNPTILRR